MDKIVLIVEDNELNLRLFEDVIRASGFETVTTGDGRMAFNLARRYRPHVIVMDIHLPGISGLEVTRALRSDPDLAGVPILAVTALAMKGDEEMIRAAGCNEYISKPVSIPRFLDAVRRLASEPLK